MNKLLKQILILVFLIAILIMPYLVFAQDSETLKTLTSIATGDGLYDSATNEFSFSKILGTAVSAFIGLLGVVFIILMIYAGYNWMTARGEEEKLNNAKDTLRRAIIGLIIVVGSYAIWGIVWNYLI